MRIGKKLFPYPILNSEKLYSQYKNSKFRFDYTEEISEDHQFYILKDLHCELTEEKIIGYIKEGKAEIVCIVESPSTMYRKKFVLPLETSTIRIPLTDLNNKVNVSAFVIAKEDIDDYYSNDFLDDYEGITFSIEKHDIIAADDGYVNTIDFDDIDDNQKNSIFIIIKDTSITNGSMQVEYNSNNIVISLPEEQWNIYDKTKRNTKFEEMYFSIIAVPALSYALSSLQKGDGEPVSVDSIKIESKWFNSFSNAYEKKYGKELTDEVLLKMNTNLAAQEVLDFPVSKAIDTIFGFTINAGGFDDDDD